MSSPVAVRPRGESKIVDEAACRGFQGAVELVGRRWTGAILLAMSHGATRFSEIRAVVDGISDRLIAQRLKELELERLVLRTVVPTVPVQIGYTLTESGVELMAALQPLVTWGEKARRR